MRWVLCVVLACLCLVRPVVADQADLHRLMRLDELVSVMREEGLAFGAELGQDMLPSGGGAVWAARVSRLYDVAKMRMVVSQEFAAALSVDHSPKAETFFGSALAQRIIDGELAARRAFLVPEIEEAARAATRDLDPTRKQALGSFIDTNDLIDDNVSGGMTSQYRFYQGLVDGGMLEMSDDDILAEAWAAEEELRQDTQDWLLAFLMLAYEDLTVEEIALYTAFSATEAGRAINHAIFTAFDRMYADLSYGLGLAIADLAQDQDL